MFAGSKPHHSSTKATNETFLKKDQKEGHQKDGLIKSEMIQDCHYSPQSATLKTVRNGQSSSEELQRVTRRMLLSQVKSKSSYRAFHSIKYYTRYLFKKLGKVLIQKTIINKKNIYLKYFSRFQNTKHSSTLVFLINTFQHIMALTLLLNSFH